MARRVYFSFHYQRDIWRANVVRKSWVTQDREAAGFWDAGLREKVKKNGESAIKFAINKGLENTSVTVVLIGYETFKRKWVQYEIKRSSELEKGLLGIYIHKIQNFKKRTDPKGINPFESYPIMVGGRRLTYTWFYKTYDWVSENGFKNLNEWTEKAAKQAAINSLIK